MEYPIDRAIELLTEIRDTAQAGIDAIDGIPHLHNSRKDIIDSSIDLVEKYLLSDLYNFKDSQVIVTALKGFANDNH